MLNIRAYLKDKAMESLPLLHNQKTAFQDPSTNEEYECYMIDMRSLTEEEWVRIHRDMLHARLPHCPPRVEDLKAIVRSKGGMPIRADKVELVVVSASLREVI